MIDNWYESEKVSRDELTLDFVAEEIIKAKAAGATLFATSTDKDVEPWTFMVVAYTKRED